MDKLVREGLLESQFDESLETEPLHGPGDEQTHNSTLSEELDERQQELECLSEKLCEAEKSNETLHARIHQLETQVRKLDVQNTAQTQQIIASEQNIKAKDSEISLLTIRTMCAELDSSLRKMTTQMGSYVVQAQQQALLQRDVAAKLGKIVDQWIERGHQVNRKPYYL